MSSKIKAILFGSVIGLIAFNNSLAATDATAGSGGRTHVFPVYDVHPLTGGGKPLDDGAATNQSTTCIKLDEIIRRRGGEGCALTQVSSSEGICTCTW
ncbi:MAG: hypothetical protein ACK502_04485 [Alphaproteobacteria bacterium]